MNPALRVLGVAAVLVTIAGATLGAYALIDTDAQYASVQMTGPSDGPTTLMAGASTPFSLTGENLGDALQNVTIRSATPGFTFETFSGPTNLDEAASETFDGELRADTTATGETDVRFHVYDGDRRVGSIMVPISVIEPQNVDLALTSGLPATMPGDEITLTGEATNPMETSQEVTFALDGIEGTVEPEETTVPANGTDTVTVTVNVPSDASGTLQITLNAENQAGQTTSAAASLPVLAPGEIAAAPVFEAVSIAPGTSYAMPVLVVSNQDEDAGVTVTGTHVADSRFGDVPAHDALGGYATLETPSDAQEAFTTTLTVLIGDRERDVDVRIDPAVEGDRADDHTIVNADYVGRLADGSIFDTSVPALAHGPFPKSDQFQARGGLQPLEVNLNPEQPGVVEGFYDALVGMAEGESKTATLDPSEGYGSSRIHENVTAVTELDRLNNVDRFIEDIGLGELPSDFRSEVEATEEGDTVTYRVEQGGEEFVFEFRVTEKDQQEVTLERLEEIGSTTTFYPMWPDATEVVDITDEHIVYETTPPEDQGLFTWDVDPQSHHAQWDNATRIEDVTSEQILLRHIPEEGSTYEFTQNPQQGPQTFLVESVDTDNVHVSTDNPHPLGGLSLTFDITLHEVTEAPSTDQGMIGGQG